MSGYNYFFKDKSAELKKQRNAAKSTDAFTYGTIGSQMGDMWRKLSPEAKKVRRLERSDSIYTTVLRN